ncbi:MAG: hypothetical protein AAGM22_29130 [Acidobacteriota bacterium]
MTTVDHLDVVVSEVKSEGLDKALIEIGSQTARSIQIGDRPSFVWRITVSAPLMKGRKLTLQGIKIYDDPLKRPTDRVYPDSGSTDSLFAGSHVVNNEHQEIKTQTLTLDFNQKRWPTEPREYWYSLDFVFTGFGVSEVIWDPSMHLEPGSGAPPWWRRWWLFVTRL